MKFFKQFSVSLMALAAATAASAANQPFNAVNATVTIDTATVNAALNGYSMAAVGGATFNSGTGVLTAPVQTVSTTTNPGPINVELADAAGLKFTKVLSPSITLSNFSFDVATGELYGNLLVGTTLAPLVNVQNQSVLQATNYSSSFGGVSGSSVTTSSSSRDLGLLASNFVLSQSFKDYMLNVYEMDATSFSYVADMIKEVRIGTVNIQSQVPEPSTYFLMGVGLACIGFVARRKSA
ncbi:MAG: PEP-CTERM sorting domain-containing protein [Aquabacterium sp.]